MEGLPWSLIFSQQNDTPIMRIGSALVIHPYVKDNEE